MQDVKRLTKAQRIAILRKRDGDMCMHPDCGKPLDYTITDGPSEVTEDHWIPQSVAYDQGWTYAKVWHPDNLRLMHKKCNAKKGNIVPNEDGTLPERPTRTFKFKRQKRAERPEVCLSCDSGRKLGPDEVCASCGSGPMPERFPRWAKMASTECDHAAFWCWICSITPEMRPSAASMALIQGESGEWDEDLLGM